MTNPSPAMRQRYLADSVATASPAKLLMMLFDRLVMDLARGEQALLAGNRPEANTQLNHAQDIVTELHVSLDLDAWTGAAGLAQLYAFVDDRAGQRERAGRRGQGDRDAASLIEPLRDTWREAALAAAAAEGLIPMADEWRQAWVEALDELEADVEAVERMIAERAPQPGAARGDALEAAGRARPAAAGSAAPGRLHPDPAARGRAGGGHGDHRQPAADRVRRAGRGGYGRQACPVVRRLRHVTQPHHSIPRPGTPYRGRVLRATVCNRSAPQRIGGQAESKGTSTELLTDTPRTGGLIHRTKGHCRVR